MGQLMEYGKQGQPHMSLLKRIVLAIYPHPWGIQRMGLASVVMLPRHVEGARHISIGNDVIIHQNSWIAAIDRWGEDVFEPHISIGDHVRIGHNAMITAIQGVSIGEGCLFSSQAFVSDHAHQAMPGVIPPARQPLVSKGPVVIGRHCFIGIRAAIMGGVTLGDYCVVGANAVVTRSFPAGSVLAGAPARLLRTLPTPG